MSNPAKLPAVAGGSDAARNTGDDDRSPAALRSYGRRKGHKLSQRQERLLAELLPTIEVPVQRQITSATELASLFPRPVGDVWLEIGFGGGEHLLWQAQHQPDIGLIGCEPFLNGMVSMLGAVDDRAIDNILAFADDARIVLDWLPAASLGRAFILFPDPWPKSRHHKRRLVSSDTLDRLARVMKPGAELRVATDIGDYMRTTLLAAMAHPQFEWQAAGPADWCLRPDDWPQTRYERKAVAAGRACAYFRFKRNEISFVDPPATLSRQSSCAGGDSAL